MEPAAPQTMTEQELALTMSQLISLGLSFSAHNQIASGAL
jgi:hypothetical protein